MKTKRTEEIAVKLNYSLFQGDNGKRDNLWRIRINQLLQSNLQMLQNWKTIASAAEGTQGQNFNEVPLKMHKQ